MIKRRADLRAFLQLVVMGAPDKFPRTHPFVGDASLDLEHAFRRLREAVQRLELEFGPHLRDIANLKLRAAHESYLAGDKHKGAQLLRDIVEALFPNRFAEHGAHKKD